MSRRATDDPGRTPRFMARDGSMLALSTVVRQRRADRRLAYTFDPGLALAERLTDPKRWHAANDSTEAVPVLTLEISQQQGANQ